MPGEEKWIWLSLTVNIGTQKAHRLLEYFGSADAAYTAQQAEYKLAYGAINEKDIEKLQDKDLSRAQKIISECARKNIRIITRDNSEYPERLLNTPNPPLVLYARGERLDTDGRVTVAVVGTRKASKHGQAAAEKFGREIAESGGVVVTGLARGVDTIAAKGAISAGGKTVAVLGCGVDICYPSENKNLMAATEKAGTVISEYPPGTKPDRGNFPRRNRIISGISLGTVVIEAPETSGALITARYALEQNRDVFAVPSGIFEKSAEGSNRLIRDGAIAVMSGHDVLAEYIDAYSDRISLENEAAELQQVPEASPEHEEVEEKFSFPDGYLEKFSQDDRVIMEAIRDCELRADDIAARCGFTVPKVLSLLTLLEIRGHIKQLAGGRFIIKDID